MTKSTNETRKYIIVGNNPKQKLLFFCCTNVVQFLALFFSFFFLSFKYSGQGKKTRTCVFLSSCIYNYHTNFDKLLVSRG